MSIDIKALRALLTYATPTPWSISIGKYDEDDIWFARGIKHDLAIEAQDDASLIVAAVNALPALLDELERLREYECMYKELCK